LIYPLPSNYPLLDILQSLPETKTKELEEIELTAKTDLKQAYKDCLTKQVRYAPLTSLRLHDFSTFGA
jgi:hypothetical protein